MISVNWMLKNEVFDYVTDFFSYSMGQQQELEWNDQIQSQGDPVNA